MRLSIKGKVYFNGLKMSCVCGLWLVNFESVLFSRFGGCDCKTKV